LVRPYSIGTCTQSETPSFAWRTEDCPVGGALLLIDSKEEAAREGGLKFFVTCIVT